MQALRTTADDGAPDGARHQRVAPIHHPDPCQGSPSPRNELSTCFSVETGKLHELIHNPFVEGQHLVQRQCQVMRKLREVNAIHRGQAASEGEGRLSVDGFDAQGQASSDVRASL
ncbi:hypothetical protein GCM10011392_38920 [Wenxinia marina]|nr:hypothetical protein GCM10011392_38920 [Wenxinia marina]